MLLFFMVVMAFMDLKWLTVHALDDCRRWFDGNYLLDGETVEWANSVQGHGWLSGCAPTNETVIKGEFDSWLIAEYAYEELSITNTPWPAIPESAVTKSVSLSGVTPYGVYSGCSNLSKMYIGTSVNLTMIPPDWLVNCTRLRELEWVNLTLNETRAVLDSVTKVESVSFEISDIENIVWNHIFPSARGGHKWITKVDFHIYNSENNVMAENVSWAEISETFVRQLSLLPLLEEINIHRFVNLDWCATANYSSVTFESLKRLWIISSATSSACFKHLRKAPLLNKLVIGALQIEFGELSSSCAPHMQVQYYGDSFLFYREDYMTLFDCTEPQKSNVSLILKTLECDCGQSLWLARAKNAGFLTGVTCSDGTELEDQTCDWLLCDRVMCNTTCICCDDWNYGLVADCRDANLGVIPEEVLHLDNLTKLFIPYNNLSAFPEMFPDSLVFADFYGNDLFRNMLGSVGSKISSLFAVSERVVRLAANPVFCVCDYQPLIKELHRYSNQIEDYDQMVCAGYNTKLSEVNVVALCAARDHAALVLAVVAVSLVGAVIALILGVVYYYRRHIQIFLFARGWCLCCINEEELDADLRYDVFLSFCHADERLVMDELLPKLDRDYAVCIHYRDWNPGDMIPSQIWKSVENSRRTIVVLSRNFIESLWGLLEFRSAYVTGLSQGRVRVVMVVLDDVLEKQDLEPELRAYIRLNTYVKWGDPWFWDKLRFALPHRSISHEPLRYFYNAGENYLVQQLEIPALHAVDNAAFEREIIVSDYVMSSPEITEHENELVSRNDINSSQSAEMVNNEIDVPVYSSYGGNITLGLERVTNKVGDNSADTNVTEQEDKEASELATNTNSTTGHYVVYSDINNDVNRKESEKQESSHNKDEMND